MRCHIVSQNACRESAEEQLTHRCSPCSSEHCPVQDIAYNYPFRLDIQLEPQDRGQWKLIAVVYQLQDHQERHSHCLERRVRGRTTRQTNVQQITLTITNAIGKTMWEGTEDEM